MIDWPPKGPSEVADYLFDFYQALEDGEAIASKVVTAVGVTVDSSAIVPVDVDGVSVPGAGVRVWVSAGEEGTIARVTAAVTTDNDPARTFVETAVLPIGGLPVSLARAKQWLRVEHDAEDELILSLLRAAVGRVETATSRMLTPKVVEQVLRGFPSAAPYGVKLFKGPAREVVSIFYDPGDGAAEVEITDFRLVEGVNGSLLPAYGESWPTTLDGPGTVRVRVLAGYDPGEMPPELGEAVLKLLAHSYQNREGGEVDADGLPPGVRAAIAPFRSVGLA